LCDIQSLLKAVNRWIGEGAKATLVEAPDADISAAAIEILRKRIAARTFLIKVKAHQREPANEGADILEDKAISGPNVVPTDASSSLHVGFLCREAGKVTYQDRGHTLATI